MKVCISVAALAVVSTLVNSAQAQWTVTELKPVGALDSFAYAASGGQQAGYTEFSGLGRRAGTWKGTPDSWVSLHPNAAEHSEAHAMSGLQQAGFVQISGTNRASLWSGTAASWVDLHPVGASSSFAYATSGTQQAGYAFIGGVRRASLWSGTAASWVDLSPAGATSSEARAASSTQQAGHAIVGGVIRASLWNGTAASWVDLHPAGATSSAAYATTGTQQAGYVRVGSSNHASLWSGTAASWVDLHPAVATNSEALAASDTQQVGFARVGGVTRASLWTGTAASWVDLHQVLPSDYTDSWATGISSDASNTYVCGYGYDSFLGREVALLWTYHMPTNDECSSPLPAVTGTNDYNTFGATSSPTDPSCAAIGTDVWFQWNSGPGGTTTFTTCGYTSVDTLISIYSDCMTSVACDTGACIGVVSTTTICAAPNVNYLIRIGDVNGGNPHTGTFGVYQEQAISASAAPTCGTPGTTVILTATVDTSGCSVTVSADASVIGAGIVSMLDNGIAPDVTAGDSIFTASVTYGPTAASGNIVVTATYSAGPPASANVPMTVPSGVDEAGDSLATAAVVSTNGPVASISGQLLTVSCGSPSNDVDMYKIQICDPAHFSATTVGGSMMQTQLFLFNANGVGVAMNDDCPLPGMPRQSCLSSTFTSALPVGTFYLAINAHNQKPRDSANQAIWLNMPANAERAPDGAGAANPLAMWNTNGGNSGPYTIFLTGVCGVVPACSADFDNTGDVDVVDLFDFLDAWFAQTGVCVSACTADFDDDNDVDVVDLFDFLDAWFAQNGVCG